jgi:methionine-rich copper-binding protein CopC
VRSLRTRAGFGTLAVSTLAALLVLAPAAAASAHDDLESASPAADESITADPGVLTLAFSDALLTPGENPDGFAAQVVDSDGLHFESGCVTVDGAQLTAPMALGDAGAYVVTWRVVSSDGHPTSGQYEFDYEPASLDGAHDGLTNAPVCGEAWAGQPDRGSAPAPADSSATAPSSSDAPADPSSGAEVVETLTATESLQTPVGVENPGAALPVPVVILAGLVGLGVIAAIVVLVVRRSRGGGYGQD